jgi:hypothetical protein
VRASTRRSQFVAAAIAVAIGLSAAPPLVGTASGASSDADRPSHSASAAGASGSGYDPKIRPKDFVSTVDNPNFPLTPGDRYVYEGRTDVGDERIVVEVTDKKRTIMGVPTVVVHDRAFVNGRLEEATSDWYAQDRDGNVWYFGEATQTYDAKGKPKSTKGSWIGGVAGAKPGIQMLADPQPGKTYRQEFRRGLAEDYGKVLSVNAAADVPFGSFPETVKTKDFTPLEPKLIEHKYYAPGVGLVLEDTIRGGFGRVELVEHTSANSSTPAT